MYIVNEAAPTIAWADHSSVPGQGQYRARTDERDGHEGDPQSSVEPDDALLTVNEQGDSRNGNWGFRCLQPGLEGVQLPCKKKTPQ